MWGRDLTHFSRAPPLRLGHRRLLLPQVDRHPGVGREVLQPGGRPFRAGLGDRGPTRAGHPERLDLTADDSARPILLVVSDDVPQMASEATRKFVTLMAVAQHPHADGPGVDGKRSSATSRASGLTGTPSPIPRCWRPSGPRVRWDCSSVRLHEEIGHVNPDDEDEGRVAAIR